MSEHSSPCPKCQCKYGYQDGTLWVCPECAHEWTQADIEAAANADKFFDSNGNELQTGDSVTTIKDLKVGGGTLKSGTKVKNIRLLDEAVNDHDISCKVDGFGSIYLKCSVVKKA